jgi:hypothetical protein
VARKAVVEMVDDIDVPKVRSVRCCDTERKANFRAASWAFVCIRDGLDGPQERERQVSLGSTAPGAWLAIVA